MASVGPTPGGERTIRARLLRVALALALLANLLSLLLFLRNTPIVFTVFMFVAQPLFLLAGLLLVAAILAELRARGIV